MKFLPVVDNIHTEGMVVQIYYVGPISWLFFILWEKNVKHFSIVFLTCFHDFVFQNGEQDTLSD